MAMFECPGCKSIVDDSIKKCPKCGYDIKKYVKSMGKAKKGGSRAEDVSFNLMSAYSAKQATANVPTLDFLSKPAEPVVVATPTVEVPAPVVETPVIETPVVDIPPVAAPVVDIPVVEPVAPVEPEVSAPEKSVSHFTDYSSVELSSVSSANTSAGENEIYNDPSYIAPIAPASVPEPQAYTATGTVQMPSYDTSSIRRVQIPAPAASAPERKPIVPNESMVPPAPVYEDTEQPTVTLAPARPEPVAESIPAAPVVSVSNAGYAKLTEQPTEMPVFDSPLLNAAQANNVRPAQPASAASLSSQQFNSASFGTAPIQKPAQPVPAYRSANLNTISGTAQPASAPAEPEEQGIFDSPILNAQARKIASGEYVPTSVASQASISAMQERKMAPPPGLGISRQTYGQNGYGQTSSYKAPAQPLVYQEQGPIGQPQYQATPQYQSGTMGVGAPNPVLGSATASSQQSAPSSPMYASFNSNSGGNGSNVNIPNYGNAGPGAANPLLAGNPLLVNGGSRQ